MKVTVTHTDVDGNIESKTSGAESAVANVNDAPTGLPTITTSGEFAQGNTLTCAVDGIADADGLGAFTYTWKRDGVAIANPNGNSNQYTLIQSDVGIVAASEIKEIISDSKIDPSKDITDEITIILKEYIVSLMKPLENTSFFQKKEKINTL